jgi:hypothetical protein
MCLPVSRLFWISSQAYRNLLGIKGYVVVVVLYCISSLLHIKKEKKEKRIPFLHSVITSYKTLSPM